MPAKKKEKGVVHLNYEGHRILLDTEMSEELIEESIGFAVLCNQKLVDMNAEYETPNAQLEAENKQLDYEAKKLTYNIEVQSMLLAKIKTKIGAEAYNVFKEEVLSSDDFKKLTERNGL